MGFQILRVMEFGFLRFLFDKSLTCFLERSIPSVCGRTLNPHSGDWPSLFALRLLANVYLIGFRFCIQCLGCLKFSVLHSRPFFCTLPNVPLYFFCFQRWHGSALVFFPFSWCPLVFNFLVFLFFPLETFLLFSMTVERSPLWLSLNEDLLTTQG